MSDNEYLGFVDQRVYVATTLHIIKKGSTDNMPISEKSVIQ